MFKFSARHSSSLTKPLSILPVIFLSYMMGWGSVVAAPTIPDAATPGGAFPREAPQTQRPIPDAESFLEIPKVIDRPLGVDEGDRVKVTEFVLKGVQTREEYGIREEDIAFIAEANRIRRQRLDEEDTGGFTTDEVSGIAEFIRRLVEEPNQRPTSSELWKLVFKLRNSEWSRGLTVGQIQEVADEITRYYRQHGLILATAFIPAQEVADGKVIIEVLEGKLGSTQAESNTMYSSQAILRGFESLKGQVVHKDKIETNLLYLSDYPGLNVSGVFQPGKFHGDSDLIIKVLEEKRANGSLQLDNNGSNFTGEWRTKVNVAVNNPIGLADKLNFTVLASAQPEDTNHMGVYGNVGYQIPLNRNDWIVGSSLAHNQFKVGKNFAQDNITGKSYIAGGYLKKYFHRNRSHNLYALGEISRKYSLVELTSNNPQRSEYDVAKFELGFDNIDTRFAGINVGVIQFYQSLDTRLGADGYHDDSFDYDGGFRKLAINYSRLQTLFANSSLLFSSQAQYSTQRLSSLEQFPLGGADNVRAYPVSEYLRDIAYSLSLEWILNAPGFSDQVSPFSARRWGEIFNVSLFVDTGGGWLINPEDDKPFDLEELYGAGFAVKFNLPGKLTAKGQVSTIIGSTDPIDEDESTVQYYLDLAYFF